MSVPIIEKRSFSPFLITSQFDQAVGSGARHRQLALGYCCLPRVACTHTLNQLQSRTALGVVFHALRPSQVAIPPVSSAKEYHAEPS
jgi:hypothetical protein